jgi:peptide/nickel transport system permease protein
VVSSGILPGISPLQHQRRLADLVAIHPAGGVVTLYDGGYLISMIRASMIEVMRQPFIRTARLKGMPFPRRRVKHALRKALITPFTVILLQLNYLSPAWSSSRWSSPIPASAA